MKFCPYCNTEVEINDNFCTECGKPLNKVYNYNNKINNQKTIESSKIKDFSLLKFSKNKKDISTKNKTKSDRIQKTKETFIDISKINFNNASIKELEKIKELTALEVNKIIELREHGTKFKIYTNINEFKSDLKNTKIKKQKININSILKEELLKIKEFNQIHADKIINLRKTGKYIKSYIDLQEKLDLNYKQINNIKKFNEINFEIELININKAEYNILNNIPFLNEYKVNTIIELRNLGTYITSFNDLKIKLNLTTEQMNQLKELIIIEIPESVVEKIDINTANMIDLAQLGIPQNVISKIILNRIEGKYVNSFEELKEEYLLTEFQITKIKEVCLIVPIKTKNTEKIDSKPKTSENTKNHEKIDNIILPKIDEINNYNETNSEYEKKQDKLDINKASIEELTKLPSINLIKAKKIIELRNEGNNIKSYEDLKEKVNLNSHQIEQIKDITIISQPKTIKHRIVDL